VELKWLNKSPLPRLAPPRWTASPTEEQLGQLKPKEEDFLKRWKEIHPDVEVTFRHYVAYNITGQERRLTALLLHSALDTAKQDAVDLWNEIDTSNFLLPVVLATEYPGELNLSEADLLCFCALRCVGVFLGFTEGLDAGWGWEKAAVSRLDPSSLDVAEFMLSLLRAGVAARSSD
jgi:hypothetical protein